MGGAGRLRRPCSNLKFGDPSGGVAASSPKGDAFVLAAPLHEKQEQLIPKKTPDENPVFQPVDKVPIVSAKALAMGS